MDGKRFMKKMDAMSAVKIAAHQKSQEMIDGCDDLLPKESINQLFGIMRLSYSSFLSDSTDDDISATKRLWFGYLKGYDEKLVSEAAEQLIVRFPKYPPTLGEFKIIIEDIKSERMVDQNKNMQLCSVCRSYDFSQYHRDVCVRGTKIVQTVSNDEIKATKAIFKELR